MKINDRPYDLGKLDFDAIRLRRRKKILVWATLPLVVMVVIGIKLVGMSVAFGMGSNSYKQADYLGAENKFGLLMILNIFEPYKAPFAKGTAELQAKEYDSATHDLQTALDSGVPKDDECQVRVNLTLAWIQKGDSQQSNKKYDDAIISYDKAKSVVDGRDCGLKTDSSKASKQAKDADKKLQQERRNASDKQNVAKQIKNGDSQKTSQDANDSNQQQNRDQPTDDQVKQLQKEQTTNTDQANKRRSDSRGSSESSTASRNYDGQNW